MIRDLPFKPANVSSYPLVHASYIPDDAKHAVLKDASGLQTHSILASVCFHSCGDAARNETAGERHMCSAAKP